MTCDEKKSCYFKGEFQEKYIYLSYNTEIIFDCMVKNKLIIANNMETKLFGQNCLINELKCQLKKSIVVWNSEIYTHCPFKKLAVDSMKYNFFENIFYTEDNSRMFMIKNKTEHCGIKMYETAEGAFLVDKNETTDLKLKELQSRIDEHESINTMFKLLMIEEDARLYDMKTRLTKLRLRYCNQLMSQLKYLEIQDDYYQVLNFDKDFFTIIYSYHGILLLPKCVTVRNITIREISPCFKDLEVEFIYRDHSQKGYLTPNLIIRKESSSRDCSSPIARNLGKQVEVHTGKGITIIKSHQVPLKSIFTGINKQYNFPHFSQLIDGISVFNEIAENFNSLEFESELANKNDNLKDTIGLNTKSVVDNSITEVQKKFNSFTGLMTEIGKTVSMYRYYFLIGLIGFIITVFVMLILMTWIICSWKKHKRSQKSDDSSDSE